MGLSPQASDAREQLDSVSPHTGASRGAALQAAPQAAPQAALQAVLQAASWGSPMEAHSQMDVRAAQVQHVHSM